MLSSVTRFRAVGPVLCRSRALSLLTPRTSPLALRYMSPVQSIPIVRRLSTAQETTPAATEQQQQQSGNNTEQEASRAVRYWLYGCAGMVFTLVVVGGTTRLTNSGLSMVDWKFQGEKLPRSQEEWEAEFAKYQQFPEFKQLNSKMTVDEFKNIFFWEYSHRMLGRLLGVSVAVPFLLFAVTKKLPPSLMPKLWAILAMIGSQGLLGWYMVKSGLDEKTLVTPYPTVSPYRLAAHLSSAFAIFIYIFWTALSLSYKRPPTDFAHAIQRVRFSTHLLAGALCTTVVSGAFVAGLDAGLVYNEFPYMGEGIVPVEWGQFQPLWKNFTENPAAVQFNHRVLALTTYGGIIVLWVVGRRAGMSGRPLMLLHSTLAVASIQVGLGITALLLYIPVPIGVLHQAGSLTLLGVMIALMHSLRRPARARQIVAAGAKIVHAK